MKIFDLKFIIIIGLTFVVYLIYRNADELRTKIENLEKTVDAHKTILAQMQITMPSQIQTQTKPDLIDNSYMHTSMPINYEDSLGLNIYKNMQYNENNIKSPKIIMIDTKSTSNKTNKKKRSSSNSSTNSAMTTTDCVSISSSKHLAISSNDNECFNETQNSLLESIKRTKNEYDFNYNKQEKERELEPIPKSSVNEIIDSINCPIITVADDDKLNNKLNNVHLSPINELPINENKNKNENENENELIIKGVENDLVVVSNESILTLIVQTEKENNSVPNNDNIEQKDLAINIKQLTISESDNTCDNKNISENNKGQNTKIKYSNSELEKMKLPEIKKICEQLNIKLYKTVNKQIKQKGKKDLINELINNDL